MNDSPDNSPQWVREVVRRLEAWEAKFVEKSDFTNLEALPPWVTNVLREIARQQFPAIRWDKGGGIDAETLGRMLGQQCAKIFEFGRMLRAVPMVENISPEQWDLMERLLKALMEKRPRAVPMLEEIAKFMGTTERFEEMHAICSHAFSAALEQERRDDAVQFFYGYAEGLKKWHGFRGHDTDATPIYSALFLGWREIEGLRSITDLRRFLIANFVTEQQLGSDPKRLQKICERIGLRFRKPGRPRKSDKPAA